ncbi:MAG: 5-formyltetrahydrofolate cyclo-ligase [Ruminococcaceae bacterium]|nr:5-formyltetrahydrofolate cyclo-ligase [Oscillospiraceae bacterium]
MQLSRTEFSDKSEARKHFRQIRASLSDTQRAELDKEIFEQLKKQVTADTVLLFYPVKGEPNVLPFAEYLLKSGVRVAFPISLTQSCELDFRYVRSLDELHEGAYGIPEPQDDAERIEFPCDCICLVPALAFDMRGSRIGYGKGYYDRFLAVAKVRSIGVAYSVCTCYTLPSNKTDFCVDTIITEKGVMRTNEKQSR